MPEQSSSGEQHRHPILIGGINDFLVTNAPSWLNYRCDTDFMTGVNPITEGEEGV
tara:strand:+ start:351 stop:515 length:165 start_codon:yes stop_codon:yes gene_type:complete